jgi:hypothetical protein
MKKVNQVWRDVDLAIATLIFRRRIHRIIIQGRHEMLVSAPDTDPDLKTWGIC